MSRQEEMVLVEINAEELVTYEQYVRMKRADAERLERVLNTPRHPEYEKALNEISGMIDRWDVEHSDNFEALHFSLPQLDSAGDA